MKAIGKGLLVVATTILLAAILLPSARAGTMNELNRLLADKRTVYVGTCHLNKAGMFANGEKEYTVHRCVVGVFDGEEEERYYALILDNQSNPVKLIRVDKSGGNKQDVLWNKGTEI